MRRIVISILAVAASLALACGCYRYSPEYNSQKGIRPGTATDREFRQARKTAYNLVRLRLDGQNYVLTDNTALADLDDWTSHRISEATFTPSAARRLGDRFRVMYVTARVESDDGQTEFWEYAVCFNRSAALIVDEQPVRAR